MDRLEGKATATDQALETMCFLSWFAPLATGITQIHFEMGGGETNRSHDLSSLYTQRKRCDFQLYCLSWMIQGCSQAYAQR